MGKRSKRQNSIDYMKENDRLFSCPICNGAMEVLEQGEVVCGNRHSFTIAKQGYVNFLTKPVRSMYTKNLFESRKMVIDAGLYNELHNQIAKVIGDSVQTILDTGCGEGSHLVGICGRLNNKEAVGVGIDIAKEGIMTAAKYYEKKIWCVGDLASSPFRERSFDVILNILSPANYDEFKRLLKSDGKIIKVVPQSGYLMELRKQIFVDSEKENYTNERTVKRFYEQFPYVQRQRITYKMPIEKDLVPRLIEMTPLGWHAETRGIDLNEVTIDLELLVGECQR